MTCDDRRTRLSRLRPRDLVVVKALIEYPWLREREIADAIAFNWNNFRTRMKFAYAVLGVEHRVHLYAEFHALLIEGACPS